MPKIDAWLDCRCLRQQFVSTPTIYQHKSEYLRELKADAIEAREERIIDKMDKLAAEVNKSSIETFDDLLSTVTSEKQKCVAILSCYNAGINWGQRHLLEGSGYYYDYKKPLEVRLEALAANDQELYILGTLLAENCWTPQEDVCAALGLEYVKDFYHNSDPYVSRQFVGLMHITKWGESPLFKEFQLEREMWENQLTLKGLPTPSVYNFLEDTRDSKYAGWKMDDELLSLGVEEYRKNLSTFHEHFSWR